MDFDPKKMLDYCEQAVKGPGKYQGEKRYVPYFWEYVVLMGFADGIDGAAVCTVTMLEKALFPELENERDVWLHEDENGFIYEEPSGEDGCPHCGGKGRHNESEENE